MTFTQPVKPGDLRRAIDVLILRAGIMGEGPISSVETLHGKLKDMGITVTNPKS